MPQPKQPEARDGIITRNPDQLDRDREEIVFWEEQNPRCVVNLLRNSPKLRQAALDLPPNYLGMSDRELKAFVEPGEIDQSLRLAFWDEYTLAIDNDCLMRPANIYSGVCSKEYFHRFIIADPKRLAYLFRPPKDYRLKMRALLDVGIERFEEILNLPITETKYTKNGRAYEVVNTKLIGEIVKIVALLDNRVKGAVAQKLVVDQTSKNLHVHSKYEPPKTMKEIEAELKRVKQETLALMDPAEQAETELLVNGFTDDESEAIPVAAVRAKDEGT